MFPARFAAGEGQVRLGYNRLVRQEGGYALTHFENPELTLYDPVDPTWESFALRISRLACEP